MEVTNLSDSFIQDFFSEEANLISDTNKPTPAAANDNPEKGEEAAALADDKSKENKLEAEKFFEEENNPQESLSDIGKFSELLSEKEILMPYEDGTLPSNVDELVDALYQSSENKVRTEIEQAWQNKISSLPESIIRLYEYAEMGLTTMKDLHNFIETKARTEAISSLDPTKEADQETIVLLQLINSGMSEADARDEVRDLIERDRLEARANQYFPSLKKMYEEKEREMVIEKQRKAEIEQSFIQNNSINVQHFLQDNNIDYLPFKMDNNYKQAVYELAAIPVKQNEDGEFSYGWESYIRSLQLGDEAAYKKYMKIMAFIANDKQYDENISLRSSNNTNAKNFKKIVAPNKVVNSTDGVQGSSLPSKQKNDRSAWNLR